MQFTKALLFGICERKELGLKAAGNPEQSFKPGFGSLPCVQATWHCDAGLSQY